MIHIKSIIRVAPPWRIFYHLHGGDGGGGDVGGGDVGGADEGGGDVGGAAEGGGDIGGGGDGGGTSLSAQSSSR